MAQRKNLAKTTKKKASGRSKVSKVAPGKVRKLQLTKRDLARQKRQHKSELKRSLPGSWRLFGRCLVFIKANWKLLGGITLIYLLLNFVLGRGLTIVNLNDVAYDIQTSSASDVNGAALSVSLFGYLLWYSGTTTAGNSTYITLLMIMVSLALTWALRQIMSGKKATVKQAYYNSMAPLVPSLLVLTIIGLQLLPMIIGGWLYGAVVSSGIAVGLIEKLAWGALSLSFIFISLYFVSSSVFAFYIVNLAGVQPLQALRSARGLVSYRRFAIIRKMIFLPFILLLIAAVVLLPLLLVAPVIAAWVYVVLSAPAVMLVHVYMYSLYRELL